MKRTELENGIAKQLSSVILREDEMLENIMQMVDAHVNKQLLLHDVSQRSELLLAYDQYCDKMKKVYENPRPKSLLRDAFLSQL